MFRIVKLLIVLLVLNAVWRVGSAYWEFYQFRDKVQETAQFSGGKTASEVQERVMQQAIEAGVPVAPETVQVRRDEQYTYIDVTYVKTIELVPRAMKRPWLFKVSVSAWALKQEIQQTPLRPR